MGSKNKLLIFLQIIQHDSENPFFNIRLYIRKMLVAVIKGVWAGKHGGEENSYIDAFRCSARKDFPVEELAVLNDDFRTFSPDDKRIAQIL